MRVIGFLMTLAITNVGILAQKVRYDYYKVYKVIPRDENALAYLMNLHQQETDFSDYQFWSSSHKIGQEADILVAPKLQSQVTKDFESLNVSYSAFIENVQTLMDKENSSGVNSFNEGSWDVSMFNWTVYHTLDQINAWLYDLVEKNPTILTLVKPSGTTHEGREIIGVKLNIPNAGPDNKKAVFVESNIHAREWITSAVSTYILNEFVNNRNDFPAIQTLVETYEWYWFPVMNPDGFVYTQMDRMWRKTRTRYSVFCWGADPNRNWDYRWMEGGASQNPCTETYAGPHALSEPSVRIMAEFISSIGNNLHAYIDFHSYSQLLMLPYGHTTDPLDNYDEMMTVGKAAVEKLRQRHGTVYQVGNVAEIIYVATGSSMDWVKATFNPPIAFTYELRDRGQFGFVLPADQITPSCEETYDSFVAIFQEYDNLVASGIPQ